jgi:hypothetical protein
MDSSALTFYIIYHKKVFEENTNGFTEDEIKNWFRWVAVNESIEKKDAPWIPKECLLYEYKFEHYFPEFQKTKFYQNSVFFHLLKNYNTIQTRYVGFGQYDMSFHAGSFREVAKFLENDSGDKVVGAFAYDAALLENEERGVEFYNEYFFKPYEAFFKIKHTYENVKKWPLFLMHTFIIPRWFFRQMMEFIEFSLPYLLHGLELNIRHLAGTLERIMALCISCGIEEGRFRKILILQNVDHKEEQHAGDDMRGIEEGKESKE